MEQKVMEKGYSNTRKKLTFKDISLPRYVKIKNSIESLMKIIDRNKVENDGKDRVLSALLQLIDENDGKVLEEKYDDIADAIYNGNVFSHYFSDKNKEKAVKVLSETSLLSDEERYIYGINFYMPGDVAFKDVYTGCRKNISSVVKAYNLSNDGERLVYSRLLEIQSFYIKYHEEIERQKMINETNALAAVQDASDNPLEENISKATSLVAEMNDGSLKESLENELKKIQSSNANIEQLVTDYTQEQSLDKLEESKEFDLNQLEEENVDKIEETEETNLNKVELEEPKDFDLNPLEEENIDKIEETEEVDLNKFELESLDELEEPKEMDYQFKDKLSGSTFIERKQDIPEFGKEVMESLKSLVLTSNENATKVKQLNSELDSKNAKISKLNDTVVDQELEINKKDKKIESLTGELKIANEALDRTNEVIMKKDEEIVDLKSKVDYLSESLETYKQYLSDIQQLLKSTQKENFNNKRL